MLYYIISYHIILCHVALYHSVTQHLITLCLGAPTPWGEAEPRQPAAPLSRRRRPSRVLSSLHKLYFFYIISNTYSYIKHYALFKQQLITYYD